MSGETQPQLDGPQHDPRHGHGAGHALGYYPYRRPSIVANWFWFIFKNLIGWILILTAMALGPIVPGPGGLPLFLIGFGLITFPGKRRITARLLSGKPVHPE